MSLLLDIYFLAADLHQALDAYEKGNANLAASNGPLLSDLFPHEIVGRIASCRRKLGQLLHKLPDADLSDLMRIKEFHEATDRLRGVLFDVVLDVDEAALIAKARLDFARNWQDEACLRAFAIVSLYDQPIHLSLQKNIAGLSDDVLRRYLGFVMRQPHVMVEADETAYLAYQAALVPWLIDLLEASDAWPVPRRQILIGIIHNYLTFGASYYLDRPIGSIVRLRAQILAALTPRLADASSVCPMAKGKPFDPARAKVRLGVISRNLGDYTDTQAMLAQFQAFDPQKYELYWYSYDQVDPTTQSDAAFSRRLFGKIHKAVSLSGTASHMAAQILADDLDVLAVGSAFSFGAKKYDALLSYQLARLQGGLNSMVPGSAGFASYDYYIVPEGDDEAAQKNFRDEATEELWTLPDPIVWYEKREPTPPSPAITRAALGIPDEAVLYVSGAAANKQMPGTLRCWLEILKQVPKAYLLFYPFNPAWGGYYIGLTFLARLRALLAAYPEIDPARVKIIRQVSPADGDRLIDLADIYLGSFPHAGATSAMLALVHGKPVLARRAAWLRSTTDPSFLRCLGLEALIAADNADLIAKGVKLGLDQDYRAQMMGLVHERMKNPLFFDVAFCSQRFQSLFDRMLEKAGHPLFQRKNEQPADFLKEGVA